mmetsp:Transcript_55179/g.96587  ORF Transcript_55179/g.96587 Transcript_55179/m.96587 type:complete len:195 (+) Transcript_55179:89-673(+)
MGNSGTAIGQECCTEGGGVLIRQCCAAEVAENAERIPDSNTSETVGVGLPLNAQQDPASSSERASVIQRSASRTATLQQIESELLEMSQIRSGAHPDLKEKDEDEGDAVKWHEEPLWTRPSHLPAPSMQALWMPPPPGVDLEKWRELQMMQASKDIATSTATRQGRLGKTISNGHEPDPWGQQPSVAPEAQISE